MGQRAVRGSVAGGVFGLVLFLASAAWGAHPLITDDAETQGKGKFQVEVNSQYEFDRETSDGMTAEWRGAEVMTILSYGLTDTVDLVLSLPYQWGRTKEGGVTVYDERGISDSTVEIKWRFFEKDGLMLAIKPGLIVPTGSDARGLGAGRVGYHAFFIGTKEAEPWEFHLNLGYIGNENRVDEERRIWHASVAAEYEVSKNLELVANIGVERNRDKAGSGNPAFLLAGAIYEFSEHFSLDCGVKYGLTAAEVDWTILAGMAFRF